MMTPNLITDPRVTFAILNSAVRPIWKRRTFLVLTFTEYAAGRYGRTADLWNEYTAWRRKQVSQARGRGQIPKVISCDFERAFKRARK